MEFGDMFKKKLGDVANLAEKTFEQVAPLEPKPSPPVAKPSPAAPTPAAPEPATKTNGGKDYVTDASSATNAKGGLFDPVEGVTLEQYATIQVRRSKLDGADEWPKLLGEYGLDEAKWAEVDKVFMGRRSDPSDMMATAAFDAEYNKLFSAASSGQFAAAAMGLESSHNDVDGAGEPVPFERYVEIRTAQECWATAGKDVNAMLKRVFNMDAIDWSNLGAYWSQKMLADISIAMTLTELQAKYRPRYQSAQTDDDLEV